MDERLEDKLKYWQRLRRKSGGNPGTEKFFTEMHDEIISQNKRIEHLDWKVDDLSFYLNLCEMKHEPITEDKPMTLDKLRRIREQNERYEKALKIIKNAFNNDQVDNELFISEVEDVLISLKQGGLLTDGF